MDKAKDFIYKRKYEIIVTLLTVLVISGVSYAWIRHTINSASKNVLKVGNLQLEIQNEDPIIRAGGEDGYAIPIEDSDGLSTKPYTFTVKNTGNISANFDITLIDTNSYTETYYETDQYGYGVQGYRAGEIVYSTQRIPDSKIRFNVREGSNTNTEVFTLGSKENRVLFTGTVDPGETKTYYLRLWIDINATLDDIDGKTFAANLSLNVSQASGRAAPMNSHIKAVYEYNQNGTGTGSSYTGCLGGAETGCVDISSTKNGSSTYPIGTIIKYEVKSETYKYFNVIKDNGSTLTLQERQNTVSSAAWGISDVYADHPTPAVTSGYALYALEQATADWTYVNDQNYSIGGADTTLGYSECSSYDTCYKGYELVRNGKKARMITVQELHNLGCNGSSWSPSCNKFVYNYLKDANSVTGYGDNISASFGTDSKDRYWIMNAHPNYGWIVHNSGVVYYDTYVNYSSGVRAVVVINK